MQRILKYKEIILLFLLLLFSAFLRLYKIADYMTFLGDEGRDVLVVYNILHGRLTFLGPTSSVGGFFLGPVYYYFMTPFLWLFNYNPVGPAVMVAIFGIATVWLVYKIGKEFFGQKTGFIAAFLYAISPIVIAYSRSSWNPNLMPFFSLLTFYIFYKALKDNSSKLFLVGGVLYGITMQLHYVAVFLGPIIIFYLCASTLIRKNFLFFKSLLLIFKNSIYIFIGFSLGLSPFFAFEVRHGFPNIRSILNFIFHSGETGGSVNFLPTIYDVFFRLFARLLTAFPPSEQLSLPVYKDIWLWQHGSLLLGVISISIFLIRLINSYREKNKEQFQKLLLLFTWFFLGIITFGFYKKAIYDYYFEFMFPLPFFLVGFALSSLYTSLHESFDKLRISLLFKKFKLTRIGIIGKILSVSIFIVLAIVNLNGVPFRYSANRQLNQAESISRFIFDKTGGKPFNFALITGGNSDHAYRYFFTIWNNPPIVIQNQSNDPERKTVTDQLLIVCEKNPCEPLGYPLWEIAGFGRAEIAGSWDVSVVKVYKLTHYKGN